MENIKEVFVINLKESTDRLDNFDHNMKNNNINYTVWNATRGSTLSPEIKQQYTSYLCRNYLCTDGMIGCHMSHMLLWKHIRDKYKHGWFIIFEDDAYVLPEFKINLKGVFYDLEHWNYNYRYPEMIHLSSDVYGNKITPHIYKTYIIHTTRAYLISIDGIHKLIEQFKLINYHVDMTMTFYQIIYNNLAYYKTLNYVLANDNFNSTVSSNTFPKLFPDILNQILSVLNLPASYHIIYEASLIGNINIFILLFIIIIVILLSKKLYIHTAIYITIELLYYILRNFKTS
jgi:GR25 family glycosyltransferase involved in LPS biosynthesis